MNRLLSSIIRLSHYQPAGCAGVDEQLHRQKGRVRKEVEQQGRRVRVAWVRRVRRRTTGQRAAAGEGEDEGVDEGVDAAGEQGHAHAWTLFKSIPAGLDGQRASTLAATCSEGSWARESDTAAQ